MSWRQFRTDLGALRTAIIDPRTTAKPFVQLWSTFSEGGVLVDTPDPLGRWAVLLHTSILLDGSITTFVQQHWLETADIAELQTHAQTHIAQTSGRIDPFDELRAIARAMWYAASLVSFALASIATARETYRTSPAGSAALICAPILLRWLGPRLLLRVARLYWTRFGRSSLAIMQADLAHLRARRAARHQPGHGL